MERISTARVLISVDTVGDYGPVTQQQHPGQTLRVFWPIFLHVHRQLEWAGESQTILFGGESF